MTPTELSRFARGEPIAVDVGSIERELDSLWKQTGQEDGATVSRAALWNVVMPARGRRALAAAKHLVDDMAAGLPTRAITIVPDASIEPGGCILEAGSSKVDAQLGTALGRAKRALLS